jgi:hypothetical protein
MTKLGRNDPCPCGSGKKYKRCCLARSGPAGPYTSGERGSALVKLDSFAARRLGQEDDVAWEDFWGEHAAELDMLDDEVAQVAEDAYDMWLFLDLEVDEDRRAVDLLLADRSAALDSPLTRAGLSGGGPAHIDAPL